MKTIGLIGGMSWESTVTYYQLINQFVKEELGGLHSAKIILYSVDFDEIEKCQALNEWDKSARILSDAAKSLEKAGADFILICTNTMHKVAGEVQRSVRIPLVHIAEAIADYIKEMGISKVALLGTRYVMKEEFYIKKLEEFGLSILIPEEDEVTFINQVIFEELCQGLLLDSSKEEFLRIVEQLEGKGAQGVILGCTEIGLLIGQGDMDLPVFDTTEVHATKAAVMAINSDM